MWKHRKCVRNLLIIPFVCGTCVHITLHCTTDMGTVYQVVLGIVPSTILLDSVCTTSVFILLFNVHCLHSVMFVVHMPVHY